MAAQIPVGRQRSLRDKSVVHAQKNPVKHSFHAMSTVSRENNPVFTKYQFLQFMVLISGKKLRTRKGTFPCVGRTRELFHRRRVFPGIFWCSELLIPK
jgi:hypothetical protein